MFLWTQYLSVPVELLQGQSPIHKFRYLFHLENHWFRLLKRTQKYVPLCYNMWLFVKDFRWGFIDSGLGKWTWIWALATKRWNPSRALYLRLRLVSGSKTHLIFQAIRYVFNGMKKRITLKLHWWFRWSINVAHCNRYNTWFS